MPPIATTRALPGPRRARSSSRRFAALLTLPLLACDTGSRATTPPAASAAVAPAASPASTAAARAPAATSAPGRPRDRRAEGLTPGDRFYDGCNWCAVQADGSVGCTERDCAGLDLPAAGPAPAAPAPPLTAAEQAAVRQAAAQLIKALQARDGAALAALLAPEHGAHLSPSPGFEEGVNAMGASEARTCFTEPGKRDWGTQDPSDRRVLETCAAHLDGYLKVLTAPGVTATVNTSTLPHARGMDAQVRRHFPGAAWVDYLVAGQGEQAAHSYQGVRLVFTKAADGWRLAGALHEYYLP